LLWASTSAGFWTASIVAAIVIVLPVPVPQQRHRTLAGPDALGQRGDRLGLVGGRGEGGVELERRHPTHGTRLSCQELS
jgi:hypothetical protein